MYTLKTIEDEKSIFIRKDTAFEITALQAVSKRLENDGEDVERAWWWKYVDTTTHIPTEFFVPLSKIEELMDEVIERTIGI